MNNQNQQPEPRQDAAPFVQYQIEDLAIANPQEHSVKGGPVIVVTDHGHQQYLAAPFLSAHGRP